MVIKGKIRNEWRDDWRNGNDKEIPHDQKSLLQELYPEEKGMNLKSKLVEPKRIKSDDPT